MKKTIVTTTINPPTPALIRFAEIAERDDWDMVVIGDRKTPEGPWREFERWAQRVEYLNPAQQDTLFPALSTAIGWDCIQRRNIGLAFAWLRGAVVVATVDDDNIPLSEWGRDLTVGKPTALQTFEAPAGAHVLDPLSVTAAGRRQDLWHRGFPVQLVRGRSAVPVGLRHVVSLVQADLWNGEPDVDAVCRLAHGGKIEADFSDISEPFFAGSVVPFNSQNTFISRRARAEYFLFPGIGRLDDIWAAYSVQHAFGPCVAFGPPSVRQERNKHDLWDDYEAELIGYKHSINVSRDPVQLVGYLPGKALCAWKEFRRVLGVQS